MKNTTPKNDHEFDFDQHELEYLMLQYPWFSKDEIIHAIKSAGTNIEHVRMFLDAKSNKQSMAEKEDL